MRRLTAAALISGEPGPDELWTLRAMAASDCEVRVLQTLGAAADGPQGGLSELAAGAVASWAADRDREILAELFDFDDLRDWWEGSGMETVKVRSLNHAEARSALTAMAPGLIVRVSEGALVPRVSSPAGIAALNIHHGLAPMIRGTWSIPWGILEGRRDWIGAAVQLIEDGRDAGPVLWSGGPQLAPGDAHADLFFRAHLEATEALVRILNAYANGHIPGQRIPSAGETSTYRSSAGLREWIKFLYLDQGRRARVLLERGVEC